MDAKSKNVLTVTTTASFTPESVRKLEEALRLAEEVLRKKGGKAKLKIYLDGYILAIEDLQLSTDESSRHP